MKKGGKNEEEGGSLRELCCCCRCHGEAGFCSFSLFSEENRIRKILCGEEENIEGGKESVHEDESPSDEFVEKLGKGWALASSPTVRESGAQGKTGRK